MAESEAVKQSRSLFHVLGRIQKLIAKSDFNGRQEFVYEALSLIESHTENIRWRNDVASKLSPTDPQQKNEKWEVSVLNEYNAKIARAKECKDYVHLGNTYLRFGMYGEAMSAYASSTDPVLLNSHLHVFQRNWPYNITAISRLFLAKNETVTTDMKLNLALAYWYTAEYGDCLSVLLHLTAEELSASRGEPFIWLSRDNVRSMLVVCALLHFDRESLEYFRTADPVARHFEVSEFIAAFRCLDISRFWDLIVEQVDLPTIEKNDALVHVADKLYQNYLFVYNELPLDVIVGEVRKSPLHTNYRRLDLLEDLRRWKAPYKIDFVGNRVVFSPSDFNSRDIASTLAFEFRRDALLLLWKKRYDSLTLPD